MCDFNNTGQKKVADLLGINRDDYPKIALIHKHDDRIEKYIF
jgi:hypothetical protein